ncbi:MAG: DUF1450 domain-containing protein [Haloarculaceae archaeon]
MEYCVANVAGDAREGVVALPTETRAYPCLERCGTCRDTPFLVVDGAVVTAGSHRTLCERIGGEVA